MSALVEAGGLAFLSGVIGADSAGDPIERIGDLPAVLRRRINVRDGVSLQAAAALAQIGSTLRAAGHGLERVVQLTVFADGIGNRVKIERLLAGAFGKRRPALTVVEVPRPSPVAGARVSLTAVAWLGSAPPRAVA
jgi:enamine deaminase RidA (YjgF/YER057c/UK114 family)